MNSSALCSIESINGQNSDYALINEHTDFPMLLCCVADGVGGVKNGHIAAEYAVHKIIRELASFKNLSHLHSQKHWQRLIAQTDDAIKAVAPGSMTTIAAFVMDNNTIYGACVGNTKVFICRNGKLIDLTRSAFPKMYLGCDNNMSVVFSHNIIEEDLVICSTDGVHEYVSEKSFIHRLSAVDYSHSVHWIEKQLQQMIMEIHKNKPTDDATIAVIKR